ncbi:MAG: DUF86 domain-containing protein [Patescibacteria group bacterium]
MSSIEEHLRRVKELPSISLDEFRKDTSAQDILLFNLTQAIQNCIDIAAHIVSDEGWGVPGTQSDMFEILAEKSVISEELAERLIAMVGFRNRVIHEYEKLNLDIVYNVWQERLKDIENFGFAVVERFW